MCKMFFIFLQLLFWLQPTYQNDTIVYPLGDAKWSSLTFIIPVKTYDNDFWLDCKRQSNFYCLSHFSTDKDIIGTGVELRNDYGVFSWSDKAVIKLRKLNSYVQDQSDKLFKPIYRMHNFYPKKGSCCSHQYESYYNQGFLRSNLTPKEYLSKLTDYRSENKSLNLIWSYYKHDSCVHIITKLGFGEGKLKKVHHRRGTVLGLPYVPYRLKVGQTYTPDIPYENPDEFLTFDWFKTNVLCKDQPWICGRRSRLSKWRDYFSRNK